jgi:hypothetical protein
MTHDLMCYMCPMGEVVFIFLTHDLMCCICVFLQYILSVVACPMEMYLSRENGGYQFMG